MDPTFPEAQGILGSFKGRILLPGYSTPLFKADTVKGFCEENKSQERGGAGGLYGLLSWEFSLSDAMGRDNGLQDSQCHGVSRT